MTPPGKCTLVSEHGRKLELPMVVFEALEEFIGSPKHGQVLIQVKSGGVAGVELRKVLK